MTIDRPPSISAIARLRHDLRTPINAIIGYSEMLLEELNIDRDLAENNLVLADLKNIRDCGDRLLRSVNSLLDSGNDSEENHEFNSTSFTKDIAPHLMSPARSVVDISERLLLQIEEEFTADIQKILAAACNFLTILDRPIQLTNDLDLLLDKELKSKPEQKNLDTQSSQLLPLTCPLPPSSNNQGKILVVDDNPSNRDLLSRQVQAQGYLVETAANGQQVLQMVNEGEFDLILLDIIMPEMDGYEVLMNLRNSQWRHIPVIMISALDRIDSVVKCIEMGAEDYLTKPFNPILLKARIGACLDKKRLRDKEVGYLQQLESANQEIAVLNERLQQENNRLNTELEIAKKLQQMILPKERELRKIEELDISGFMEPADKVGGDYYDILQQNNRVKIAIGDVTGHGLESGVLSIMVQTAVRTLIETNETDTDKFIEVLNRTIYRNVQRMDCDKNFTFCLMDYHDNKLNFSGQHEEIIVIRADGEVERIDTIDLGFPLGLEESVTDFIASTEIELNQGDIVILYTDGVTEAENNCGEHYGLNRLCEIARSNFHSNAYEIQRSIIEDLHNYIGKQKVYDDITLIVFKKK